MGRLEGVTQKRQLDLPRRQQEGYQAKVPGLQNRQASGPRWCEWRGKDQGGSQESRGGISSRESWAKLRTLGHPHHSQSISQLESPKVIPIVDAIDLQTPSQALRFYCIFVDLINL